MPNALSVSSSRVISALDIGSSRITCMIAEVADSGSLDIIGIGTYRAKGIRAGQIIDMDLVRYCVLQAVSAAEKQAETQIKEVHVSLSSGQVRSTLLPVEMPLRGETIEARHIQQLTSFARKAVLGHGQAGNAGASPAALHVMNAIPLEFVVDGEGGISDPCGMVGSTLGTPCHVISTSLSSFTNLARCLENCHLVMRSASIASLAAADACLTNDERELGTTLIDLGGGTTSMVVYGGNKPCYTEVLPLGGRNITSDIANVLPTTLVHAERLKLSFGRAFIQPGDERSIIEAPTSGDPQTAEQRKISVSFLNQIIQARVEEIFELVAQRLEIPQIARYAGRRVVLTGGGALLPGIKDEACRVLQKEVRIGRPFNMGGILESAGPEWATAAGLLKAGLPKHRGPKAPPLAEPVLNAPTDRSAWHPIRKLFGI